MNDTDPAPSGATLTIIESPYGSPDPSQVARNVEYLHACIRDAVVRCNESPYASHLMLTRALDDRDPGERELGISAGLLWGSSARRVVFYMDLGISAGMKLASAHHEGRGAEIVSRWLPSLTMDSLREKWELAAKRARPESLAEMTYAHDEWKSAAQLRMTTGFAFGFRAQLRGSFRPGDQTRAWLAGFDFAAEMFGVEDGS